MIDDDQWHHIGLIYNTQEGWKRQLYLDGVRVAMDSDPVQIMDCQASLYIGAGHGLEAGAFFSGMIDDVRIYNKALSVEEIANLAQ